MVFNLSDDTYFTVEKELASNEDQSYFCIFIYGVTLFY